MKDKFQKCMKSGAALGASMYLFAPMAFAQQAPSGAIDVTSIEQKITAQLGPIGLLGAAVLGIIVAIKAYQWVRRAMS